MWQAQQCQLHQMLVILLLACCRIQVGAREMTCHVHVMPWPHPIATLFCFVDVSTLLPGCSLTEAKDFAAAVEVLATSDFKEQENWLNIKVTPAPSNLNLTVNVAP
jgi:hypothetical protein